MPTNRWWAMPTLLEDAEFSLEANKLFTLRVLRGECFLIMTLS